MSALIAAPVLLSIVFAVSGAAKLRDRRGTEDAMVSLRLPMRSLHSLAAALLPLGELLLAVLIWVPVVPLQVAVALAQLILCLAYLVIIIRAVRFPEPVDCSCFGTLGAPTVSGATVGRNAILVLLAILAVVAAATRGMAQAVLHSPGSLLAWAGMLALTVVLTALTVGVSRRSETSPSMSAATPTSRTAGEGDPSADGSSANDDELADYERRPVPHVVVRRPDGELIPVRDLAFERATLLVWLSPGCGPCERITPLLAAWRTRLGGAVRVVPVLSRDITTMGDAATERYGPDVVSDIHLTVAGAFEAHGSPSAALLGVDGLLAGGPVAGADAVTGFVVDIIDQLVDAQILEPEDAPSAQARSDAP